MLFALIFSDAITEQTWRRAYFIEKREIKSPAA